MAQALRTGATIVNRSVEYARAAQGRDAAARHSAKHNYFNALSVSQAA
ncbi:MAG: hypothetical protein ACP5EN_14545 [Rhodovulum sp.]